MNVRRSFLVTLTCLFAAGLAAYGGVYYLEGPTCYGAKNAVQEKILSGLCHPDTALFSDTEVTRLDSWRWQVEGKCQSQKKSGDVVTREYECRVGFRKGPLVIFYSRWITGAVKWDSSL